MRFLLFAIVFAGCSGSVDDPTADESAVKGRCNGPFDCFLPNPDPVRGNNDRLRNRYVGGVDFTLEEGTHLYTGFGGDRGAIVSHAVRINYGQRKTLLNAPFVYVLGVTLADGSGASGWVPESAIAEDIGYMHTVRAEDPGQGDYQTVFTITGGDVSAYGDLKVNPNVKELHQAASDYLVRAGNVVNFCYNLPGTGGASDDTFPIGAPFHRSLGVEHVDIPLYYPRGRVRVGHLTFVYGHVGSRWGWIARDALTP
jgi:hypothetical protein